MKTLIASLLLIASSAFASEYSTLTEVNYVSWCYENQVLTRNPQGKVIVIADCTNGASQYFTCTEQVRPKGRMMLVTAFCKAN